MVDALLIDENGDKVVFAKDLSEEDKALYFVCPECKTRVDLVTNVSTQKSHFRHH